MAAVTKQASRKRSDEEQDENPWEGIDVGIAHAGKEIVLPSEPVHMDLSTAIATLERKKAEDEQTVSVNETIDAFPKDGAVAFQKAMQRMFGYTTAIPTPTFFGPRPPATIDVEIGYNKRIAVIWGMFQIPGVEGVVRCDVSPSPKGPRFMITGEVRRKHFNIVHALAEATRKIVAEESIYRGQAVALEVDEDGDIDWNEGISFMDLSRIPVDELVFAESTERQIRTSLWTPIERTEMCRQHRIPLKRGILMEGKYGTGKTLTSSVTATKAVDNGWTFITINRVSGLDQALMFARKYQPAVIFAEDIDRIVAGDDRTVEIDDVLNTIDGIGSKGTEIMVVLTTNHIEKMNRAMLRPGRLDAIVSVLPPDGPAVKKLIRNYGRTLVDPNDPLEKSAELLSGNIPAIIREAIERAKLYAISNHDGNGPLVVRDQDIADAAIGMKPHMALLEAPVEDDDGDPTLREVIEDAVRGTIGNIASSSQDVTRALRDVQGNLRQVMGSINEAKNASQGRDTEARLIDISDKLSRVAETVGATGARRRTG